MDVVDGGSRLNFRCHRLAITDGPLLAAIADESIAKLPMLNAQESDHAASRLVGRGLSRIHQPMLDLHSGLPCLAVSITKASWEAG